MKYNVFTDFHHASLLQSFILLFEKRLGGKVFRPIGTDWFDEGFWKVYDHPETVKQFLGINAATPDGTAPLNQVVDRVSPDTNVRVLSPEDGVYFCHDIDSDTTNKAITLNMFYYLPIDIVIATLPQHIEPFKRLAESHPNKPKFIYQIGNQWEVDGNVVKNVMASANVAIPEGVNGIVYHQEFDTTIFKPMFSTIQDDKELITPLPKIYSFVNVFQDFPDWPLFQEVEKIMSDWRFKSYGGQCRDGAIGPAKELAIEMNKARFIWHTKAGGDGYGHVLHNAAAVGRPVITRISDYSGKLGEKLLIDGETCIAVDGLSPQAIVDKLLHFSQPELYNLMREKVYNNFLKQVDFDKEATEIEAFLGRLA